MNEARRTAIANFAGPELESDRTASSFIGMATRYLATAGECLRRGTDEDVEDALEWAQGAAGWAVAAAVRAGSESLEEVLAEVAVASDGEDTQAPSPDLGLFDFFLAVFGYLGRAGWLAGAGSNDEAKEEAVRAAAALVFGIERRAAE